MKKQRNSL